MKCRSRVTSLMIFLQIGAERSLFLKLKQSLSSSPTTFFGRGIVFVSYLFLSVIYCASIISFIALTSDYVVPFLQIVVLSFFCMIYAYCFLKSTMSMIATCSISIILLLIYILAGRRPEFFVWVQDLQLQRWTQVYDGLLSFAPLTLIWALYITIFTKKMFQFLALILPGLIVFMVQLSAGGASPISFYACLGSILLFFLMRPYLERHKNPFFFRSEQSARSNKIILSSVSLCTIAVIVSAQIAAPLSSAPAHSLLDVFGFSQSTSNRNVNYAQWSHPGKTSNRTQLGGNMVMNNAEAFTLTAQTTSLSDQHLAATRKGVYSNNQWSANASFSNYEQSSDYNLLETRARQLALGESVQNLDVEMMQLTALQSNEATLFHPLTTTSLTLQPQFQLQQNSMGDKILSPALRKGEEYQFSVLTLTERELSYMDQNFTPGLELDWNQYPMLQSETGPINDTFADYQQWIQMNFRNMPDSITPRTIDLAKEITKDIISPYEKVRALEAYLQEIPYTLTPGPVPYGQDLVDYFLFDHRMGYCTYYATALCMMARSLGLPTRYVEGYHVSGSLEESVTVTNASAHAWTEVYFPHMGWITFDPTGTDPNATHNTEEEADDVTSRENPADKSTDENADNEPSALPTHGALSWPFLTAISIALLALCGVLTLFLLQGLRQRYWKSLDDADDRTFCHGYLLEMARLIPLTGTDTSLRQQPHETVTHFFQRMEPHFETLSLQEVATILQQGIYSDQGLSPDQRSLLTQTTHKLEQLARQRLGNFRYLLLSGLPQKGQPKRQGSVTS